MYIAPIVWKNENEPRVNIRKWQTIAVVIAGILPTITLSYLTAPFVSSIAIRVPTIARGSRDALLRWSSRVPPDTRLELVTLRTWPVRRTSAVFLHELRALDTQRWRYANIGREASNVSEDKKSIWRSFLGIINEPRFKFYVKPGLAYTHRTGVGGVWENVAKIIQEQTWNKDPGGKTGIRRTPARLVTPRVVRNVKRHTARSTK
ncbi:hypothetical protein EJ04DRAFT_517280 [Polyplosphaeria fusca]|uniref:Uncharacterized protein n=1 Tax=Polyplosphaeria fusca TaxID=682080 RepID=A0A9P4UT31_9PLEO|nr:hypothetical protein EJ04DRAFT_517280 [Polyplosphaeria fusca]